MVKLDGLVMQFTQLQKNLIIYIDPGERTNEEQWLFVDAKNVALPKLQQQLIEKKICVIQFTRRSLWRYALLWWQLRCYQNIVTHTVLFKNDGLLSSFFDAKDSGSYQAFCRAYLPEPRGLKSRIINRLPLSIRADNSFLAVSHPEAINETSMAEVPPELKQLNYMFFSNADGKLLLVDGKSFQSGTGLIAKTTTNPHYLKTMAKEFETLQHIYDHSDKCGITPVPIKHIHGKRHEFFLERYVGGRSLREILRAPQTCASQFSVCTIIDRLDDWFNDYRKCFKGTRKPFQELYLPLFTNLRSVYATNPDILALVEKSLRALVLLDKNHSGLIPVIAHNDLWPGNFVMTSHRLVAVDWERAASDRSELFDYFWLIISAVLEYQVGSTGIHDYAAGFRSFLNDADPVCGHARDKIISRLVCNNIPKDLMNLFLTLFLLEWSVQGWLVLKRQTDMDKLALGELLHYVYCK